MSRLSALLALPALLALLASACGSAAGDDDGPAGAVDGRPDGPRVVATTTILGDVVGRVLGDAGTLEVLMEPGQDPHGFAVSARQAQALREADLVVANGLRLEASLLDALAAAEEEGVEVLRVAEEIDALPLPSEEPHGDEGQGDHGHEGGDPHVWFDPVRMAEIAEVIASRLARVDDTVADDAWAARGQALAEDILATHEEVASILSEVPQACRTLVTNHDNLRYLAERYGFEVVGAVIPGTSTQAEPSAGDFAALVELLRARRVPALFAESMQGSGLVDTLAGEVGRDIEVVTLYTDSLGEPGSGAETYTGLLTTDARRIADALGSC